MCVLFIYLVLKKNFNVVVVLVYLENLCNFLYKWMYILPFWVFIFIFVPIVPLLINFAISYYIFSIYAWMFCYIHFCLFSYKHHPAANFILVFFSHLYHIFKKKKDSQESNSAQLNFIKFLLLCPSTWVEC